MLNPIIYSFTIREYKKSAQRLVIRTWQILYHCLPKLIPSPPDLRAKRLSHHHHRAESNAQHKSSELDGSKVAVISARVTHKCHQTEPSISGQKKKVTQDWLLYLFFESCRISSILHYCITETHSSFKLTVKRRKFLIEEKRPSWIKNALT